jgi:hypothetical protein
MQNYQKNNKIENRSFALASEFLQFSQHFFVAFGVPGACCDNAVDQTV